MSHAVAVAWAGSDAGGVVAADAAELDRPEDEGAAPGCALVVGEGHHRDMASSSSWADRWRAVSSSSADRSKSPSGGSGSSVETSGRITIGSFEAAREAGQSNGELTLTGGGVSPPGEGRGGPGASRTSSEVASSRTSSSTGPSSMSNGGGSGSSALGRG